MNVTTATSNIQCGEMNGMLFLRKDISKCEKFLTTVHRYSLFQSSMKTRTHAKYIFHVYGRHLDHSNLPLRRLRQHIMRGGKNE
jgi:hypothetical protein